MVLSIGVPGPWSHESEEADIGASWVGGSPCLTTAAFEKFHHRQMTCGVCQQLLSLVTQVHAPLDAALFDRSKGAAERCLLLLGCTKARCGKRPGSWRAFRVQKQQFNDLQDTSIQACENRAGRTNSLSASQPFLQASITEQNDGFTATEACLDDFRIVAEEPSTAQDATRWSVSPASSQLSSTPLGAQSPAASLPQFVFSSGFDFATKSPNPASQSDPLGSLSFGDLDEALSSAISAACHVAPLASRTQKQRRQHNLSSRDANQKFPEVAADTDAARWVTFGASLPKFHLSWCSEPPAGLDKAANNDAQHIAELLEQYQADHATVEPGGESWAGEGYERTTLANGDRAFPKFQKRLARSPTQCVRYSLDGSVLWPAQEVPEAEPCGNCGAARKCELQIMPALHHAINEGLSWQQQQQQARGQQQQQLAWGDGSAVNAVSIDSWMWLTAAVFTCSASCVASNPISEEIVHLSNEA